MHLPLPPSATGIPETTLQEEDQAPALLGHQLEGGEQQQSETTGGRNVQFVSQHFISNLSNFPELAIKAATQGSKGIGGFSGGDWEFARRLWSFKRPGAKSLLILIIIIINDSSW